MQIWPQLSIWGAGQLQRDWEDKNPLSLEATGHRLQGFGLPVNEQWYQQTASHTLLAPGSKV